MEDEFRRRLEAAERLLRSLPATQNDAASPAFPALDQAPQTGEYEVALEEYTAALEDFSRLILDGTVRHPDPTSPRPDLGASSPAATQSAPAHRQ